MKVLLFSIFGIILPAMTWYFLLLNIYRKKNITFSLFETIGYSLLLGIGIQTIYMFFLGRIGIKYSLLTTSFIYWITIPLTIITIFYRKKSKLNFFNQILFSFPKTIYKRILSIIFMAFIWRNIYSSFFITLHTPTYPDDAFVNRNFRAKVFYHTKELNYDKPNEPRLFNGGFAVDYPMLNPLFKTYSAFSINEYDDRRTNIIAPLMNILSLLIIFWFFSRKYSLFRGLFSAAMYTMIPQIVIHSFNTYAEIWLIAYLISIVLLLYEHFKDSIKNNNSIIISWILLMFLWRIKNEGFFVFWFWIFIAFAITILFKNLFEKNKKEAISLSKESCIKLAQLWLPSLIFYGIRKTYLSLYNIHDTIWFWSTAKIATGFAIEFQKAALLWMKTIVFHFWWLNIIPLIFIGTLAFFRKKIVKNNFYFFLALCVLVPFAIMFFFFIFTNLFAQSMTTGDTRQFMTLISIAFIFIAILFNDYFTQEENITWRLE